MSYIANQDIPVGSALNRLGSLSDVNINNPQNGDTIVYNSTTGKWENSKIVKHLDTATGTVSISNTGAQDMYYTSLQVDAPADATLAISVCWVGAYNAISIDVNSNIVNGKFVVHFVASKQISFTSRDIRIFYI